MDTKKLKNLKRSELLDLLLQEAKENAELRKKVGELQAELDDRSIRIEKSGTMAEAALSLNKVFEAADAAAKQYLDQARDEARKILNEAYAKAKQMASQASATEPQNEDNGLPKEAV